MSDPGDTAKVCVCADTLSVRASLLCLGTVISCTETGDGCLVQSMTGTELPGISKSVVQLEEHLPCSSLCQGRGLQGMHRALQKGAGVKISKDPHETYDLNMLTLIKE